MFQADENRAMLGLGGKKRVFLGFLSFEQLVSWSHLSNLVLLVEGCLKRQLKVLTCKICDGPGEKLLQVTAFFWEKYHLGLGEQIHEKHDM